MSKLEQAARQALEALETLDSGDSYKTHNAAAALREALAEQAEQEPIYISESCAKRGCACHYSVEVDGDPVAVYSTPVRTVDLTDREIEILMYDFDKDDDLGFARAVIAKFKEKNQWNS